MHASKPSLYQRYQTAPSLCALTFGALLTFQALPAHGSLPPLEEVPAASDRTSSSPVVARAQKALSKLGLYLGPEDGYLNPQTRAAIAIYQRAIGLEPTERLDIELLGKLEYAVGVRMLMRQLEAARSESIDDAHSKLMNHPATRDLIQTNDKDQTADATRDATPCFKNPTALCLLTEALESAKAIAKPALRDWAMGEILIAEARAGLGERAMETASRINDPRLVIVALRDIAEAQAAAGRPNDARTAAEIIPDPEKKADALMAIAEIQLRRGDTDDATETTNKMLLVLDDVDERLRQIALRTRAAEIYARAGARDSSESQLTIAEGDAAALPRDSSRSAGMRHVASALADMAETERALDMLNAVSSPSDKIPVLMSAAEAQARAGDAAAALATAESIGNVRYRALLLGRIALAQAAAGNLEDADTTLEIAQAAIDRIDRPYARAYAISRIALAMTRLHDWSGETDATGRKAAAQKAVIAASGIDDRRLKAQTLWLIAAQQRVHDDHDWQATEELAATATDEVVGALSRVWMFAELAESHAGAGEAEAGWRAFERGVAIAADIDNAWSRARTMAKLAATLIRLVDPGRGRGASEEGGQP